MCENHFWYFRKSRQGKEIQIYQLLFTKRLKIGLKALILIHSYHLRNIMDAWFAQAYTNFDLLFLQIVDAVQLELSAVIHDLSSWE